jgi:hypothetical protein
MNAVHHLRGTRSVDTLGFCEVAGAGSCKQSCPAFAVREMSYCTGLQIMCAAMRGTLSVSPGCSHAYLKKSLSCPQSSPMERCLPTTSSCPLAYCAGHTVPWRHSHPPN